MTVAVYEPERIKQSERYVTVEFPDGGIAFRIDRDRGIIEVQRRGVKYYFDLLQYTEYAVMHRY